ncbi:MAG: hypothetical protein RMM98_02995 [Acidobacteriota bacterium]|nr:hypothetical protein [Blastocatellia bacterium]MDW8238559.1 hypothetical protein [Acidobacteriota bacterium]
MSQQVVITTDSQTEIKPLIESAIRTELRMLELGLQRTSERLRLFEEQYQMTSEEFEQRWNAGHLPESLDFVEWAGEIQTHRLLQAHRQALQGVHLD